MAPFSDGAIGIAWPIPSEKKPAFMAVVVADGLMPNNRTPRYKVIYEVEEHRLSDLHAKFRYFVVRNRARFPRGVFANTLDLAMTRSWKLLDAITGSPISLRQALTLWAPNNLEHYFSLIHEQRPLDSDSKLKGLIFEPGSKLPGWLLKQLPTTTEKKIDDYPPLAALGFALEALMLAAHKQDAPRTVRLANSGGWT